MLPRAPLFTCLLTCVATLACAGDSSADTDAYTDSSSTDNSSTDNSSTDSSSTDSSSTDSSSTDSSSTDNSSTDSSSTDSSSTGDSGTETGPLEPVAILNGSFEITKLEPGCHSNLSNAEFTMAVDHVTAFGEFGQADLYSDCFGTTSDGLFHVGLGADADQSDAIALELSAPLDLGYGDGYRLRFIADYGATGGATSTNVQIGVSSDPNQFGVLMDETGQLDDEPTEYEFIIAEAGPTYITVQVEADGDLGWAMIDDFRLEPVE